MSDTHINAYFADVDEAKVLYLAALTNLEEAKARLAAKKEEIGWQEPKTEEPVADNAESKAAPVPKKKK